MEAKKKQKNKQSSRSPFVLSGILGGIIVILFLIAVGTFWKPFNYVGVLLVNPVHQTDSLRSSPEKLDVLNDLRNQGVLLTPEEYTSRLGDYYNTLVAFLAVMFVFFTLVSLYNIKDSAKTEIESRILALHEEQRQMDARLADKIREQTISMMNDSKSFNDAVITALKGKSEDELVTKKDINIIDLKVEELETKIEEIEIAIEILNDPLMNEKEIE
jgi:hypothetical protein